MGYLNCRKLPSRVKWYTPTHSCVFEDRPTLWQDKKNPNIFTKYYLKTFLDLLTSWGCYYTLLNNCENVQVVAVMQNNFINADIFIRTRNIEWSCSTSGNSFCYVQIFYDATRVLKYEYAHNIRCQRPLNSVRFYTEHIIRTSAVGKRIIKYKIYERNMFI